MAEFGMICRSGSQWRAKAVAVNARWLVEKHDSYIDQQTGEERISWQVRITPKGLDYLRKRLLPPPAPGPLGVVPVQ